jgi:hypothetical protein
MNTSDGIVDEERNPFTRTSWVKQGLRLTGGRASELNEILGLSVKEIKSMDDDNVTNYPAFVGIRWGYAEIVNDRLTATKKWEVEKEELLKEE